MCVTFLKVKVVYIGHRVEKVNFMFRLLYLIYSHITVSRPGCYCLLTFSELISVSGVRFNVLNINVDNKLFLHVFCLM